MASEIIIPQIGENITFTPGDWLTFQMEMQSRTYDLGYKIGLICLVIGFVMGAAAVYFNFRMKNDGSSE
jgi:hypothetical protein